MIRHRLTWESGGVTVPGIAPGDLVIEGVERYTMELYAATYAEALLQSKAWKAKLLGAEGNNNPRDFTLITETEIE